MKPRFATRMGGIRLSPIRRIMEQAGECINLGIGEPDFFAPRVVRDEAHRVLEEEKLTYSPNAGIPELCEAVRLYHGGFPAHRTCVTNGSQEALFDVVFTLLEEGDEVLIPDPGFPAYASVVGLAGATAVPYPLPCTQGFQFDPGEVEARITRRTRALLLNSPSNPTGRRLTLEQLRAAEALARRKEILLISDEIYREIYYTPGKPPSLFDVTAEAIVLSGVSKMASMTGWRIGWACGPGEVIEQVIVTHQNTSTCASTLSQKAALKVFTEEGRRQMDELRSKLRQNFETICAFLDRELPFPYVRPEGAFYAMLSIQKLGRDSLTVCQELLKAGVATIPGAAFGGQGEGFLRLSFACQPETLREGLARLKDGLSRLSQKS